MESPEKPGELVPRESAIHDPRTIHRRLADKSGEARRNKLEIVRGTARNITFSKSADKAEFELAGRKIKLMILKGPIRIAEGDTVVVAGARRNPLGAGVYFNETTGANSFDITRKAFRWALTAAAMSGLIAVAILLTVAVAAAGEPDLLAGAALPRVLIYVFALVGASIGGIVAWIMFSLGMNQHTIWKLVRFVAYGK